MASTVWRPAPRGRPPRFRACWGGLQSQCVLSPGWGHTGVPHHICPSCCIFEHLYHCLPDIPPLNRLFPYLSVSETRISDSR